MKAVLLKKIRTFNRKLSAAIKFALAINRADDLVFAGKHKEAIKLLSRLTPPKLIWQQNYLLGECLYSEGEQSKAFEQFELVLKDLRTPRFTPQDRWHACIYLYKKYGFFTEQDGYGELVSEAPLESKLIKRELKRRMPLQEAPQSS